MSAETSRTDDAVQPSSSGIGKVSIRSIPPFVWVTSFTMFTLLLLGTLLLPFLLVPDEKHHADMVLMVQEGIWLEEGWPELGDRLLEPAIIDVSLSVGPVERETRLNRAAQHPPLFYLTAAATSYVITLPADNPDLVTRLWSSRFASVLVSALLPMTFYLVASELTRNRWIRLASAVVPLGIPGITLRNGPMVNNDALLVLLTSFTILFAVRVAKGDLTRRTGVLLGLATGLAAFTKGHALVVIPTIVFAYLVDILRRRRIARDWLISAGLCGGMSLLVGGWWWIRNIVLFGTIQPIRDLPAFESLPLNWATWLTTAMQRIVGSFWGGTYALGGRQYMPLFWILTALLVLASVIGWVRSRDRIAASAAGIYAALLIPTVFLASALLYADRGKVSAVHGRYFFPGLVGVAPLIATAIAGTLRRAVRWLPALFVAGSIGTTLLAIRYMLLQYWSQLGPAWGDRWSTIVASTPMPEPLPTAILVLSAASFLTLFIWAVRTGLRGDIGSTTADSVSS